MGDGSLSMAGGTVDASNILDIYPLNHYYFGSKEALPLKEEETLDHRIQRLKFNYNTHGIRTCVQAVFLVELFKHPHLLLLQVGHSMFKLPGGRLRPGESEIECLRRKLSSKLSMSEEDDSWEECTKLFLVRLPESCKFIVPTNIKLIAVPLCQVHENYKTYGPIIAGVPQLLSKFSYNNLILSDRCHNTS